MQSKSGARRKAVAKHAQPASRLQQLGLHADGHGCASLKNFIQLLHFISRQRAAVHFQHFYQLAKKSVNAWLDDYAPSMGAAISYYTVFSIAPLLIIVIAVAGFVWGREAVQGQILTQLNGLIGHDGASGVQALIESANKPVKGVVATIISVAVLVVGATTVFAELQSALDRVWDVPAAQKASGIWATLRARLLSLGFILGLGFLLAVSLVISAGVAAFGGWATGLFPGWEVLLQVINTLVSLGISTVLFAMIFKLMPQASVSWRDVWVGAIVTAVLFEVGKALIGLYIGKSSVTSSFAAAGSLVVLLVWVYYSAQIFLLGAEFTWVFAHDHGSRKHLVEPASGAKPNPPVTVDATGAPKELPPKPAAEVPRQSNPPVASLPVAVSPLPVARASGPTFKQRAVVYAATTAAYVALRLLLKKRKPRTR
jgi:membrane protein